MRIALLHNASAGDEDHEEDELQELIRQGGHELVHVAGRVRDLTAALQSTPCDLVVVAGGDGTVGKAACELSGWQVPLAILALGTANNTARALNVPARLGKSVKRWGRASAVPFDLGLLSDGAVKQRFAEGVGWGVFPAAIAAAHLDKNGSNVSRTLKRDRKRFRDVARQATARPYQIEVDGRDLSGDYLLVEVMNLPLLGPRLELSSASDSGDGAFEVVLVPEAGRSALEELTRDGALANTHASVERGSRIRVSGSEGVMHRDGQLLRHRPGPRDFQIEVEPAAITFLR